MYCEDEMKQEKLLYIDHKKYCISIPAYNTRSNGQCSNTHALLKRSCMIIERKIVSRRKNTKET